MTSHKDVLQQRKQTCRLSTALATSGEVASRLPPPEKSSTFLKNMAIDFYDRKAGVSLLEDGCITARRRVYHYFNSHSFLDMLCFGTGWTLKKRKKRGSRAETLQLV